MSSRDIAELCEKRHDNVRRTVEYLADRGVIASPQFEDVQEIGGNGRLYVTQVYHLEKRDSFVVVAQLSPEFTARLVDRWQELEAQVAAPSTPAIPQTYAEALRLAAEQSEVNAVLQIENKQQSAQIIQMKQFEPKAGQFDAYLSNDGLTLISDFSNKHGIKINHPGKTLRRRGYMMLKRNRATKIGVSSGLLKNVVNQHGYEYEDRFGRKVEAQQLHIATSLENVLLQWIVNDHGVEAFRSQSDYERAKSILDANRYNF